MRQISRFPVFASGKKKRGAMFQGAAALSLDTKGRLAIPARHRDALASEAEGHLVLTAHPHRCLILYPRPAWEPIRDKLMTAPSLEKQSAQLQRLLVGFAEDQQIDAAGRILVSPVLRNFAALDKQVMLVGQGTHFEIWNSTAWEQQLADIIALGDKLLPPGMENFSL
jgi:MraZ protein